MKKYFARVVLAARAGIVNRLGDGTFRPAANLCVAGPVMAVGLTQENEGLMGLWWRELLVLSVTQAAQVFLLKGALGMGITWSPLLAVAFLWVAVRAPSVLRTMAYHTGVGTATGSAAQAAGTAVIFRRLAARGV